MVDAGGRKKKKKNSGEIEWNESGDRVVGVGGKGELNLRKGLGCHGYTHISLFPSLSYWNVPEQVYISIYTHYAQANTSL